MRHFAYLSAAERAELFHLLPGEISPDSPAETLAFALGATLYTPATKSRLAHVVAKQSAIGVMSMALDLEDAVADDELEHAEVNLIAALREIAGRNRADHPLLFVRVRGPEQMRRVVHELGDDVPVLSGFILPKFDEAGGTEYLETLAELTERCGHRLFAMPVLETPDIVYRESRVETLVALKRLLDKHRDRVLAVRIGATDLCGIYGIRRDRDLTIYDLRFIGDAIADIVNVMGRADDAGFVITAPVWEYFSNHERIFKPQLRATPFEKLHELELRQRLVVQSLDGLIHEVILDKANGLFGKTCIHPTHVAAVHALSVVTHEEYSDASDILATDRPGGVQASGYRNKMNEVKPHRTWAQRVLRRAEVFGVAGEETSFVDLLAAAAR